MSKQKLSLEERRARLERRANVIRSRLLRTVDALDVRRHQVAEVTHHAKRIATPVALSALGVGVVAAGVGFALRAFLKSRRERQLSFRIQKALAPFRTEQKPSFGKEMLKKLALTAFGIAANELVKRVAVNALDGRLPSGQLADGPTTENGHANGHANGHSKLLVR